MPFILSDELRNALLGYLVTKPYQEVAQVVGQLASLPVHEAPKPAPKEDSRQMMNPYFAKALSNDGSF